MSNRAITQNGTNTGGLLEGQSMFQCRYDRSNTTIIRPHGKLQIFVLGVPGTRVLSSNTSILTFSKVEITTATAYFGSRDPEAILYIPFE